jgi:hypothetical protein
VVPALAVLGPDGRLDQLGAVVPRLEVAPRERDVVGGQLDPDDARLRPAQRHVGHRQPDVRAQVPDEVHPAALHARGGQVVAVHEDVPDRVDVGGALAHIHRAPAQAADPQLDLALPLAVVRGDLAQPHQLAVRAAIVRDPQVRDRPHERPLER